MTANDNEYVGLSSNTHSRHLIMYPSISGRVQLDTDTAACPYEYHVGLRDVTP